VAGNRQRKGKKEAARQQIKVLLKKTPLLPALDQKRDLLNNKGRDFLSDRERERKEGVLTTLMGYQLLKGGCWPGIAHREENGTGRVDFGRKRRGK